MYYLNETHIKEMGLNWKASIEQIENAVLCLDRGEFAQPIKPYLRYKDLTNRIIAMPAYLGAPFDVAGIKWIASFPNNINLGIPRAHSVVILNNAETGEPFAIVNTALLSIIRTASVSGLILKHFLKQRKFDKIKLGMTGFGPIGQYHLKMCKDIIGTRLSGINIYDKRDISTYARGLEFNSCSSWEEAYEDADVFITCTVSKSPYIDKKPKPGSLHLNVSLRDYQSNTFDYFKDAISVDDWEEICRENTDIERFHLEKGLKKENTHSIIDIVKGCISSYDSSAPVMFNPMGMAIFDMAIAKQYLSLAHQLKVGQQLD
jgi:ornithine cyclodeaminase